MLKSRQSVSVTGLRNRHSVSVTGLRNRHSVSVTGLRNRHSVSVTGLRNKHSVSVMQPSPNSCCLSVDYVCRFISLIVEYFRKVRNTSEPLSVPENTILQSSILSRFVHCLPGSLICKLGCLEIAVDRFLSLGCDLRIHVICQELCI